MDKFIISIVGPTGIGKTNLSLKLASHFQTEIISADSRQFYKEIPIGTAAPSAEELQSIPHHFIHHKSITESYSVGQYEKEALERIKMLHKTHRIVILIGGSGLYINSILKGLDTFPKVAANIREELNLELKIHGIEILQKELKIADPETGAQIDLNNSQRIIRALEICRGSKQPYSQFLNKEKKSRVFNVISIGLEAERIKYWLGQGAKPTTRVARILGENELMPMPANGNNPQKAIPKKDRKKSAEERKEKLICQT